MASFLPRNSTSASFFLGLLLLLARWRPDEKSVFASAEVKAPFTSSQSWEAAADKLLHTEPSEKFLYYPPHSGFGNQVIEFRHALRVAGLLNSYNQLAFKSQGQGQGEGEGGPCEVCRTLIVPPILRQFDSYLGRCEGGTALPPQKVHKKSWAGIERLLRSEDYVSMADVIDVSALDPGLVRTIDLRIFGALFAGLDIRTPLASCSWCGPLVRRLGGRGEGGGGVWENFRGLNETEKIGRLGYTLWRGRERGGGGGRMHFENRSCRETVFMYERNRTTGSLVTRSRSLSNLEHKCPNHGSGVIHYFEHNYLQKGLQIQKEAGSSPPEPKNILEIWGRQGSVQARATILTLPTTMHFYDLEPPLGEDRADRISCETEYLRFVPPIWRAAQSFSRNAMKDPYVCLHFRGGNGFAYARQQSLRSLSSLLAELRGNLTALDPENGGSRKGGNMGVPVFIMTDLRTTAWKQTLKDAIEAEGFGVRRRALMEKEFLKVQTEVMAARAGVLTNRVTLSQARTLTEVRDGVGTKSRLRWSKILGDMSLYVECATCSCAKVAFLGNEGSTISELIHQLRAGGVCDVDYD